MYVLIACEESQRVCNEFRKKGHEAYSCDIIEPSGGHPEWHIKADVTPILNPTETIMEFNSTSDIEIFNITTEKKICFGTMDGKIHIIPKWDLIIAHPPCTYLATSGNRWFNVEKYGDKAIQRLKDRELAADFFMLFANADCDKICIENPIGVMSSRWRKPNQIIEPYYFGEPYQKRTCLWLKGLPNLVPSNIVEPEPRTVFKSGSSLPGWYADTAHLPKGEREKARSKTFLGIAKAMADQWG